jgi:hypothetical protein
MMNGPEKSDSVIVAVKPANKAAHSAVEQSTVGPAAAEPVEYPPRRSRRLCLSAVDRQLLSARICRLW